MLTAGAAQNQQNGIAVPSLIQGTPVTPDDHIQAASCVNPTAELVNRAIRPEIKRVVFTCLTSPERLIERRNEVIKYVEHLTERLEPERNKWAESLPTMAPARQLNIPFSFSSPRS